MQRPRVLMIAPMRPARSGNGLAMRICLFIDAIETFADLDVIVVPVAGEPPVPAPAFAATTRFHVAPARAGLALSLMSRMVPSERHHALAAFGRPSMCGFLSTEATEAVARVASHAVPDLVLVSRAYMLPLVDPVAGRVPVLVDLDEDDHASTMRRAVIEGATMDWARTDAAALDRIVGAYRPRAAAFFLSSAEDLASICKRHAGLDAQVVVNAVTVPDVVSRRHDGRTIVFVGALGYRPNADGVEWFANTVAPRMRTMDPRGFTLLVAGAHAPRGISDRARHPRVEIMGAIADLSRLYARATVAIAPMRAGGGGRTKVIEAAAHGVSCVSHRTSANPALGRAGWVAGDAREFAAACSDALNDPVARQRRERLGRRIAAAAYDRRTVIGELARTLSRFATARAPSPA